VRFKLLERINLIEESISKIEIQIQCMSNDVKSGNLSMNIFNVRKVQLDRVVQNLNEVLLFLEGFYLKVGGIRNGIKTEKITL